MTKLKTPLFSLDARNSLSKAISFVRRRGQKIAEKKPELLDVRSLAQLSWRHMYLKAVALWHALSTAEQADWESQARSRHMTGFAWFMSQALKPNPGLYLPLQGGTMSGDIDMAKNRLLKLPAPTDAQEAASKTYHDTSLTAHTAAANAHHIPPGDGDLAPAVHGADKHTDITRWLFIPAGSGTIYGGALSNLGSFSVHQGAANAFEPRPHFTMKVPDDFVSFTKVEAVWSSPAAAGNMRWRIDALYATSGEAYNTHSQVLAYAATATGGANIINVQEPANPLTLVNLAIDDYIGLNFRRDGADASDTLNDVVNLLGLLFTYIANQ